MSWAKPIHSNYDHDGNYHDQGLDMRPLSIARGGEEQLTTNSGGGTSGTQYVDTGAEDKTYG